MNETERVRISKFLSLHLRHAPERIGLTLDPAGWVAVAALLAACRAHGVLLDRDGLDELVATNPKRRFAFDATGERIRASQGHSVPVDLGLPDAAPPARLYHGTGAHTVPAILADGLRPMGRHNVHLSAEPETARGVGARHGRPVVLVVDAAGMAAAGHRFRVSANGVWLADAVPPDFLRVVDPQPSR